MYRTKFGRSVFAILMTFALVFQMASPLAAIAATVDKDTTVKYKDSLGDEASTEYAGRVWTDKSVFAENVTFDTYGGGTATIELEATKNEDFLIAYSALATTQSVSGQSKVPVDVVLVLDISGSMSNSDSNMDNNKSRIYNTVQAANAAIDELMKMNENNRVAVAVFSSNAQVLLPLDRYTKATKTERVWVPNTSGWGGSYQNVVVDVPYFTLNRESASSNYAELTATAIRKSNSQTINTTIDVEGGTNIQLGLYEGMKVLADVAANDTTVTVNGQKLQRVPSVILLSDGYPTYSSDSAAWWAPQDNYNDGPGSAAYAGNGMKAILTGAYMKAAIDRKYGVANTAYATTVYTVGMGITGLSDTEKNLAYMTLDPGTYWDDTAVNNTMKTTIKNYWSAYTANNNTGELNINVGQYSNRDYNYKDKNYALKHPNTGYDVDPVNGYDYVDDYYDADNAAAVTNVFQQIVSKIAISAPQVPTEIKGEDPLTDGYITYADPIGQYMEVKDVKSVIYAGTQFNQKTVATEGSITTYTFAGEVHSPVYGDQNIQNIQIFVEKKSDGNEVLTIKIPASVIPLRVNEVELNSDGSVKSHTNNGAFPARVVYSVGLQEGIKKVADDGDVYVDSTKLSNEYMLSHVNPDGSINFYSNIYTGTNTVNGSTAGNATVEFEPAHNNPFYYIQEDMPIYKDAAFTAQVTAAEGLDDDTVYYYKDTYYHGTSVENTPIARTGKQLTQTAITTGTDGYLYRAAGSPRLNRILRFEGTKSENATGTAEDFYAPIFVHAEGNPDPYEGKFVIYHGNNGVLSMLTGGNLVISKTVASAAGLTAPGETFVFTIDLDGQNVNGGEYIYVIRDAQQNQISQGTISKSSPTISLTDGQTATVYSLPPMTTYTITEAAANGFTSESTGATGTIHAGHTQYAAFTNTYSVAPVTSEVLAGTKTLKGRAWAAGDSFTFFITPYNNCPLPEGYDPDAGVTVTAQDAVGDTAVFSFGAIEFTAPGIYRYTIAEKEPENNVYLPGMTYSRALFRAYYVVVDNGDGTLSIDQSRSGIQRLYDDAANQLFYYDGNNQIVMNAGEEAKDAIHFTNTYSVDAVVRVPTALKAYADPSGTKPLVSGMFQFKLEALGYYLNGDKTTMQQDINIPMPAGTQNGAVVTTNEGHNVTFPAVTFEQHLLTDKGASKITYCYRMSEVVPAAADKIPGMTYDSTTYDIAVEIWVDAGSSVLQVNAIYPNNERIVTFENSYHLNPVTGSINGTKVLNGRDMLSGESFAFSLVGANAATNNAVRNGEIVVPNSVASVSGGKNGEAQSFSFDNIQFTKPGTYTFLVSETAGSAPSVTYDDSMIAVTFEIADTNGDADLEIVSVSYSDGGNTADFVNTYTYQFNDTPVTLKGTKNLTGKSLLEGEFYFRVKAYHGSDLINEYLVSHAADDTATDGVYSGEIVFISDAAYNEPGTYTYYISEQIPADEDKVGGTTYDPSEYRYTVVISDDNAGNLVVTSKTLEKLDGSAWIGAQNVVFNNTYVPAPTVAYLPLIKKVLNGDRKEPLKADEFSFQMSVISAQPADGIHLPAVTKVTNAANGDIEFDGITFTKAGTYIVGITEVIPDSKLPGITYSEQTIHAVFQVTDNRNGTLAAVMPQFDGGDTFINEYKAEPATYTPTARKIYEGDQMRTFDFVLSGDGFESQTKQNNSNGDIVFDALTFTQKGTYTFTITEQENALWGFIKWDTNVYTLQITVEDNGAGKLEVTSTSISSTYGRDDLVFRNVHEDIITKKEVFLASAPTVSIDGNTVEPGDVLLYKVSYTNYAGQPVDVVITDVIPQFTSYVDGTAGDGVYADGKLTWNLTNIAVDETVTVDFQVKVVDPNVTVANQAEVLEGTNLYKTNETANPVAQDTVEKDVFRLAAPTVSIDGEKVEKNDILLYKVTYTNSDDTAATVTITDVIPAHTSYVDGTAGDGVYADGKLTWNLELAAGESKTVSFQVKVNDVNITVANQAVAMEGGNALKTNIVTNPVVADVAEKDVFLVSAPTVSVDGKKVAAGQILLYKITYTNSDDAAATATITDTIPAHTSYVDGTAGDGVYADGKLTWTLELAAGESKTVSFQVKVNDANATVTNQATALEGENSYETNAVTTPVVTDEIEKDVFLASAPTVSIDGKKVEKNDILLYKVTYTNSDDTAATVTITDVIPAHTSYVDGTAGDGVYADGKLTWNLELAAGESKTVSFQVKVDDVNITVTNQATALEGENSYETNIVSNPVVADKVEKDVFLASAPTVSIDGKKVQSGETLLYTITYTNSDDAAANVVVKDTIPQFTTYVDGTAGEGVYANGQITWTLALAAGESKTVSFQVTVNETGIALNNQATALEGENSYETNIVTNPVVEDAVQKDVSLASAPTVSIDGEQVQVGETLLYTITYTNSDDAAATVTITDVIPAHTSYVDGTAGNGVYVDGKLTWTLELAAGESKTVSFQVKVNAPDVFIDNQATAFDGNNQLQTNVVTNHTYEEVGGKDVALAEKPQISIDGQLVQVGQVLEYTIDYTNVTDAPVDVTITDTIPAYTKLVEAGKGAVDGDVITWKFAAVQPRQTVQVTFRVEVVTPGKVIENQAQIFDGSNKLTNKVVNSTPEKAVDKQVATIGETLLYTITYINTTGAPADVVITDTLIKGLSYVEGSAENAVYADGTLTWNMEDVAAGATVKVTFLAVVTADVEGAVENTVQIVENGFNIISTNKTVSEVKEPALQIHKQQAVGSGVATTEKLTVKAGDEVTYILTITNSGEGDAYGIAVADKIPAGLQFVAAQNGGVLVEDVVVWELAELKSGESAQLTFKLKIPSVQKDTVWTNIAAFAFENNPAGPEQVTQSNEVEIQQKVPTTPVTGDSFNGVLFITLMVLSTFGIAAVMVCKKREEEQQVQE